MRPPIIDEPGFAQLAATVAEALGEQFVALYLEGSFAWGAELPSSDIDLRAVIDSPVPVQVSERLKAIARQGSETLGRQIDLQADVLADLLRVGAVRFQKAIPLAGRDVRVLVPLKSIEAFSKDAVASARRLASSLRSIHGRPTDFPLGTPNPNSEFGGYDVQQVIVDGVASPSTKRLVTNVLAVATALIAARGRYVMNKHEVASLYRETLADEWHPFVSEVYINCHVEMEYRLPISLGDRERVRDLCKLAPGFENRLMLLG